MGQTTTDGTSEGQGSSGRVPTAYLVTAASGGPPARARLRVALELVREPARNAAALMVGLWPLWTVFSVMMMLVWVTAMHDSP